MNFENHDGFIAIYRWCVEKEDEPAFRDHWREATYQLLKLGSLGSTLCRGKENELVAIALWPTQAARKKAFDVLTTQSPWPAAKSLDSDNLQVIDDLWKKSPFKIDEN